MPWRLVLLTLVAMPLFGPGQLPAQERTRADADSALAPVLQALAANAVLQQADPSAAQYVLLERDAHGALRPVGRFTDRRWLHVTGREGGRAVVFGWFRAGYAAAAPVYFYVVHAGDTRTPRLVPAP